MAHFRSSAVACCVPILQKVSRRAAPLRRNATGDYMELTNSGLQALQHIVHTGDAFVLQLSHVLDSLQLAQPGDEAPITCEIYRCDF